MTLSATFNPEQFLRDAFLKAIAAVHPAQCIPDYLSQVNLSVPKGRFIIIGAGKAAAAMAQATEIWCQRSWSNNWSESSPEYSQNSVHKRIEGLVVTRYGHGAACQYVEVIEAAHPVPDAAGEQAAQRMLQLVQGLSADDFVLCLMSGGGSALLSLPAPGITAADKRAVNRALLASGAAISEMNCVRRHLSAIKGGHLALACAPAKVLTLLISDVPGDDPAVIASGPTIPDHSTPAQAWEIIQRYQLTLDPTVLARVQAVLQQPVNQGSHTCPLPNDPRLANQSHVLLATAQTALEAVVKMAHANGIQPLLLGGSIEGDASEVAKVHAGIARQIQQYDQPISKPCLIISGGETTVTLRDSKHGRGGRNAEFMLSLAIALNGLPGVYALAGDTDGIDGTENTAAFFCGPEILQQAEQQGLSAKSMLAQHDAWSFFDALQRTVSTGPTCTNVNDLRLICLLNKAD